MLILIKIAITGGLGSGKSTALAILKKFGAHVISADEIVHQLLSSHTDVKDKIAALVGNEILQDNQIDKKKLAQIVFHDRAKLLDLEEILHPLVFEEIEKAYKIASEKEFHLFVAEIPLLYETDSQDQFDYVITIKTEPSIILSRLKLTHAEFKQRMKRQISPQEKATRADFVIDNNSTVEELTQKMIHLIKEINPQ